MKTRTNLSLESIVGKLKSVGRSIGRKAKDLALYTTITAVAIGAAGSSADANMIVSTKIYDGANQVTSVEPGKTYRLKLWLDSTQNDVKDVYIKQFVQWQVYPSSDGGFTETSKITASEAYPQSSTTFLANDFCEDATVSPDSLLTKIDEDFTHMNYRTMTANFPKDRNRPFAEYDISFDPTLEGTSQTFYLNGVDIKDTASVHYKRSNGNLDPDYTTVNVTPEPATIVLLGIGSLSAFALRRKK